MAHNTKTHPFHIVALSPWPIVTSICIFFVAIGGIMFMHKVSYGLEVLITSVIALIFTLGFWWRDVIIEAIRDKAHTGAVKHGLRIGMALFILTEVMFFAAFFGAFFKFSISPVDILDGVWPSANGVWPPAGIHTFDAGKVPLMNTLILLLSGSTVTWAHHAVLEGKREETIQALICTVALGIFFTCTQAYEYYHAPFAFHEGIYPSNFYMATGFHGLHVIIGTLFLAVCLYRSYKDQFTPTNHLGFEFATWYWHFVDVVWLFLFTFIYVLD